MTGFCGLNVNFTVFAVCELNVFKLVVGID